MTIKDFGTIKLVALDDLIRKRTVARRYYTQDRRGDIILCLWRGQKAPQERQLERTIQRTSSAGRLPVATRGAVHAHMEAATKWAERGVPRWENDRGSHPQHHRVWFKFVDLVTRIGSARLQCTEIEVFDHFLYGDRL